MYQRLYPVKNTTIFRSNAGGGLNATDGLFNTGKNPVMQLMTGKNESQLVLAFEITQEMYDLITAYTHQINLKLFDVGALSPLVLPPQEITLYKNTDDFIEGDGTEFTGNTLVAPANWVYRNTVDAWSAKTLVQTITTDSSSQDLVFEDLDVTVGTNTFFITVENQLVNSDNLIKYIYSKYTSSIFVPYLEIIINNEVNDNRFDFKTGIEQKLYLINKSRVNFTGVITAKLFDSTRTEITTIVPVITNPQPGVYCLTTTIPITYDKQLLYDRWLLDNVVLHENSFLCKSQNEVQITGDDFEGYFFYPTTAYPHETITHGDKILFKTIAEKRNGDQMLVNNFEFQVISDNNFVFIPWQPCEVYRNQIFFYIQTNFLFPEMNYEVHLRLKTREVIHTSGLVYKFLCKYNGPSHLRELSSSPHNTRDWFSPSKYKQW